VPGNAAALGGEDRRRAIWFMTRAVHALDEVLKFIPPGADQVPDAAFFTEQGRAIRTREPGRFRKLRLEAVLGAYEEMLRGLGVTLKPRPVRAPVAPTQPAEPTRRRTPTMEILVPAQQPTSGRKRTPTMELLVPASPQMPSSHPMPSSHAMPSLSTASAGMPSMPSMPAMPPPPAAWPTPPQSIPFVVTADEARALGLPSIGFRVDLAGTSMSGGKFPEAGKYLTASGPPGGPLLAIVWATAQRESHLGAVEAALREHFSQPWQQPLVIGTGGSVHIGGAPRPALAFMTGESLNKIAWCGVVLSTPNASVLVTLGRGPGYAAAMSCEEVLAHPSLAAFARSFTLLP
jgi:hypothetical protein